MPAEPSPEAHDSPLAAVMTAVTRLTLRFPLATLCVAVGLAVASLVVAGTNLGYKTGRLDLLDPESDYNRLWIDYIREFGGDDDAVVVVEGAGRDQIVPVLHEISTALAREDRLFHAVLHDVDLSKIRPKGLYYLSPDELNGIDHFLADAGRVVAGEWTRLKVANMLTGLAARLADAQPSQAPEAAAAAAVELERFVESLQVNLGQDSHYQSPWPGMPAALSSLSEPSSRYLLAKEGRMGFVLLRLAPAESSFAGGSEAADALRSLLRRIAARHPDTRIGLTGLPIMENDEMAASQSSMVQASLLSFVGVVLVVVAGFGGVRHSLLANLVLLIGMAWAFGFVTVTVGHLNILSITFTATLIGIGIDYGTYFVARYMQLRREGHDCEAALLGAMRAVGPSITTGAVATAVAFFAAGFSSFTGVAELGFIAGGGILLCAAAELLVLPAVIYLVDRSRLGRSIPEPLPVHAFINPLMRIPRLVIVAGVAATVLLSGGLTRVWYDHNLLNMQPQGLESVELERRLLSECDQSMWFALSISDSPEELLARRDAFLRLESVERTEEIVSLLPAEHEIKQPIIARIQGRLAGLPERPPLIPIDALDQLGQALAWSHDVAAASAAGGDAANRLAVVRDVMRRMSPAECVADLSRFQQIMAGDLLSRLHALRTVANPDPPRLADLPESLVHRFVGQNGRYLLKIYGRGDIWNMTALKRFVDEVRSVDPRATGNPLQAYEASLEMKASFEQSAWYALAVIAVVLWLDFRNVRHALLAALPLGLGMLQTFGLLGYLDVPLNPANMIALPIMLGIGIDYGVHVVHQYREQPGPYRISPATAIAVAVDALTTILGFGTMMIASHQGLQSLGRVITLGVTFCTLSSLIVLPALLTWISRNRPAVEDAGSVAAARRAA